MGGAGRGVELRGVGHSLAFDFGPCKMGNFAISLLVIGVFRDVEKAANGSL